MADQILTKTEEGATQMVRFSSSLERLSPADKNYLEVLMQLLKAEDPRLMAIYEKEEAGQLGCEAAFMARRVLCQDFLAANKEAYCVLNSKIVAAEKVLVEH